MRSKASCKAPRTDASNWGHRSQVTAVSNVSSTVPRPVVRLRWYGAPRNALRQAPTAPSRPVLPPGSPEILIPSPSTLPPASLAMAMAWRIRSPWGSSADSKPITSKAWFPSIPAALADSPGSSNRQLAGHSFAWTICRTASAPDWKVGKTTPAEALNWGLAWMRIHASVMIPSTPSLPITRRSGLGPAPLPGSRRDSQTPTGVIIRTDSTKSSMWV